MLPKRANQAPALRKRFFAAKTGKKQLLTLHAHNSNAVKGPIAVLLSRSHHVFEQPNNYSWQHA